MTADRLTVQDERLRDLVPDGGLECVADGFRFLEGPVWHPVDRHLVFSDILGNRMFELVPPGGPVTRRSPSNMANGNTYDRQGRLLTCEHATSRLVREEPGGTLRVLADRYDGRELNSPNDVIVASDGTIYFTDPLYGRDPRYGVGREPGLPFRGVFRIGPEGRPDALATDFDGPNGLCLSLDERHLFVNDSERRHIRRFTLDGGALTGGEVWAQTKGSAPGVPDGMKIDSLGNLYCCGPGGIHVFDRAGRCLGVLGVPEVVTNFTWGDPDLRSLYICATTTLYRCRTLVPGLPAF